jgi:hypothetical protein
MVQRIEMDLQKIEVLRLSIRAKTGILPGSGQQHRDRPLDQTDGDQGVGIDGFDGLGLAAGPLIGDLLAEPLVIEEQRVTGASSRPGIGGALNGDGLDRLPPGGRGFGGRCVSACDPCSPLFAERR